VAHGDDRVLRRGDWDSFLEQSGIYVGSPATVRARLEEAMDITGANYFVGAFFFGNLTTEQMMRSLRLFAEEVIPAFR
jgi:alkanesulfonate monooxygenase SsuD/methylene tetrahydromethanopterin reductase-like flavin-dependent oxidoreductase (luciferase family)